MRDLMRNPHLIFTIFINSLTIFPAQRAQAQVTSGELKLLHKLDSISASTSASAYFADLYFITMVNGITFFEHTKHLSQKEIHQMQAGLAGNFFAAADSFAQKKQIPAPWKRYYDDTSASVLRHILLGVNAHINGDLWQALVQSFSYAELQTIKPLYYSYYHGLLDIYDDVYDAAYAGSRLLRVVHGATRGVDKWYGKKLLHRWLRRQMKLACLYYRLPDRFKKQLHRLQRKMYRLNRAIIHHF